MKVYIVTEHFYDESSVYGVYSTQEKAEKIVNRRRSGTLVLAWEEYEVEE